MIEREEREQKPGPGADGDAEERGKATLHVQIERRLQHLWQNHICPQLSKAYKTPHRQD